MNMFILMLYAVLVQMHVYDSIHDTFSSSNVFMVYVCVLYDLITKDKNMEA